MMPRTAKVCKGELSATRIPLSMVILIGFASKKLDGIQLVRNFGLQKTFCQGMNVVYSITGKLIESRYC